MTCFKRAAISAGCAVTLLLALASPPDRAWAGTEPYIGDIMIVGFNFCPRGWLKADGQLIAISQNTTLFSLLGTTFGGDGQTNFALPDLRGRAVMGVGQGPGLPARVVGEASGNENKTMTVSTMPSHSHMVNANNLDGDQAGPGGKLLAAAPTGGTGNETIYSTTNPNVTMATAMISSAGQNTPIDTRDPYLALYHCIATEGAFPSRP